MKKIILIFISLMSVVFCNATNNENITFGELRYELSGSEATVVGLSAGNNKLKKLIIPEVVTYKSKSYTVTKIGEGAFWRNNTLCEVIMPNTVKVIQKEAFYSCRKMSRIHLSNSLEVIGISAFEECLKLDSVVLPKTLKELYESCFGICSRLKDIYCLAPVSAEFFVSAIPFTTFGTLHVLRGCKQAYIDNGFWDYYFKIVDDIDPNSIDDEGNLNLHNTGEGPNSHDIDDNHNVNDNGEGGNSHGNDDGNPLTGINGIIAARQSNVFTLSGLRMNSPLKGINIINGKKVFVK